MQTKLQALLKNCPWPVWVLGTFLLSVAICLHTTLAPVVDQEKTSFISSIALFCLGFGFVFMTFKSKAAWTLMFIGWTTGLLLTLIIYSDIVKAELTELGLLQILLALSAISLGVRYARHPYINVRSTLFGRADRHAVTLPLILEVGGESWPLQITSMSTTGLAVLRPPHVPTLRGRQVSIQISGIENFKTLATVVRETPDAMMMRFEGWSLSSIAEHIKVARFLRERKMKSASAAQAGYSLVELMVVVGVSTIVLLAVTDLILKLQSLESLTRTEAALQSTRLEILNAVLNADSWQQTVSDTSNTSLSCLRLRTPCSGISAQPIVHLRNAQNGLVLDLSDPTAGLDRNTLRCSGYSPATATAAKSCPFQVTLTWTPVCDVGCMNPQITLNVSFTQNGNYTQPLNLTRMGLQLARDTAADTLYATCVNTLHGTFNATTSSCTWQRLNIPCASGLLLTGFDSSGAPICEHFTVQTCSSGLYVAGFDSSGQVICDGT